jgi:hypothetical protein
MYYGELLGEVEMLGGGHFGDLTLAPTAEWVRDVVARRAESGGAAEYEALCAAVDLVAPDGRGVPHLNLDLGVRAEEPRLGVVVEVGPAEDGGAPVGARIRPLAPAAGAQASRPEA